MTQKEECGGGPAFNAAYLCAMWGEKVELISRIGNDTYGKRLLEIAAQAGIGTNYLIKDDEIETPHSYIFSNQENGSRTLFNFPGEKKDIKYKYPDEEVSVILSDGHEPEISVEAIHHYKSAISIVDAGTCRESTMQVAKEVDYLVCSEDFARQYTGKTINLNDPKKACEIFEEVEQINHKHAVVTLGEKGLLYRRDGKITLMPAFKVKAVDTNGAGDIFHGAFAYAIKQQLDFYDVLKISSMASAISVQTLGAQSSIPQLTKVTSELQKKEIIMTREDIFKTVDHTLLAQTATWEEIKEICDDAIKFQTASVCIPASYVKRAKDYVDGKMAICTVIGFPNGYSTTAVKEYETKDAILNGADEIDMVINLGDVKDKHFDKIKGEIALLKSACGDKILKVIIETCLLTEEEKIKMCEIVTEAGADFIKTSTGFSTSGATFDDIALFKKYVGENVKIKAAGGISSFDDAKKFIELGADRLGTSRLVKIAKAEA